MKAMTDGIQAAAASQPWLRASLAACGGGGTQEIAVDGDDGLDGPLPTAPDGRPRRGPRRR